MLSDYLEKRQVTLSKQFHFRSHATFI